MFDSHELSPNTHGVNSLAFPFSPSSFYIPPSSVSSPLTLYDAHEMGDLIRRTMTRTDVAIAIATDIATYMETTNMSGQDFLNLSPTNLQKLSKNNEQVFRELGKLQQIPHDAMTYVSTRSPSVAERFPELASLIRNHRFPSGPDGGANSMGIGNVMDHLHNDSGSSAMLAPQLLEGSLNHEAFDFSDDEDKATPDLHSTVATVNQIPPLPPLPSSPPTQAADPDVAVLRDDLSPLGHSIHPDTPVDPTTPQNDLTITAITPVPNTHACPATTSADAATDMLSTEKAYSPAFPPVQDEPATPTMTFYANEASIHGLDRSELVNPSAGGLERDINLLQNDSVAGPDLPAQCHSVLDTRSSSPALSYVDEDPDAATQLSEILIDDNIRDPADPNILLEQDGLPIIPRHCNPITELPDSENSLTLSPQSLIKNHAQIAEDKEALERESVAILSTSPSGAEYNPLNSPPFSEFHYTPDLKPYNPINDTRFDVDQTGKGQTYETPQSSDTSKEGVVDHTINEADSDSSRYLNMTAEDPRDSLASNGTHEPIDSRRSSPQPLPSSLTSFLEPTTVLSHTRPHTADADIQSVAASIDENLETSVVDVSDLPPLAHPSNLATLEVDFDSAPQTDLNKSSHDSAITYSFNTLPPIPVTPSDSPILEGLYQYITMCGSDAPGVDSQENSGVDKVSSPIQRDMSAEERTLCPPLEAPCIGSLSSTSGNNKSNETSGSNIDNTLQPDLRCLHLSPYLGMSNRGHWPFQRMQLGVFNAIPTFFALDRETINRIT